MPRNRNRNNYGARQLRKLSDQADQDLFKSLQSTESSEGNKTSSSGDEQSKDFFAVRYNQFTMNDSNDSDNFVTFDQCGAMELPNEKDIRRADQNYLNDLQIQLQLQSQQLKQLEAERDSLKQQFNLATNKNKQLSTFKTKANCLETHNNKLKAQIAFLSQENTQIKDLNEGNYKLQLKLQKKNNKLEILQGKHLEKLSMGQSLKLLNTLTQTLNKVQTQIRNQSDALLCISKCIICFNNDRTDLVTPCGHFAMCEECARPIQNCPICRARIASRVKVHVA